MDTTIIAAPSSTKNRSGERDPEMHQTKKGNRWHFGMKAHIAVDADSGLVHTVTTTTANEADVEQITDLLHVKEEQVWTDSAHVVTLFALSNLWMARHQLIKMMGVWCARKQPEGSEQDANRLEEKAFRAFRCVWRASSIVERSF